MIWYDFLDFRKLSCERTLMGAGIEIPIWLAIVLGILAFIGLLDRLLMPSVRWYLRRRVNRVIERLNDRLQLSIQPFKLTRRKVMIDRLVHDPKVMEAVAEHAKAENMLQNTAQEMARKYAREIVPSFSASAYFGFAIRISRFISNSLYRVRVGFIDDAALREVNTDSTVIFVMNHRSNMDYVLVTFLVAERSALSYAVGEWARVWPLQQLIRAMGAYFIRRKSRNLLYRRVLARYVQLATEAGVTQAIFPEGGLSRDGRLGAAKLGLLSYILGDYSPETSRDVVFIPVGLNYDRVLEDRVLTAVVKEGMPKFRFQPLAFFKFVGKQLWLRLTGKFYRFGYACVSFGRPISLKSYMAETAVADRGDVTENLGQELMHRIAEVVPVLPVSLVSHVLLQNATPLNLLELKAKCHGVWRDLAKSGAYSHIPHTDEDYAVNVGLRMLTLRHLVDEIDGKFSVNTQSHATVAYYANAIAHYFEA
ncbi:MAG: 1-acyl-sn-glycerol-3-phosphate acyltransferase [Paracoccaceae bacterium]